MDSLFQAAQVPVAPPSTTTRESASLHGAEEVSSLLDVTIQATVDAITDAVFIYDAEGRITRMNTAARQMFALDTRPEYASLPFEERMPQVHLRDEHGRSLTPDELPQRRTLRGEILKGPTAVDVIIRALDGRDVWVNQTGAPIRDGEGNIVGAVAVCRDVTEQRKLEQQTHATLDALLGIARALVEAPDDTDKADTFTLGRGLAELIYRIFPLRYVSIFGLTPGTDALDLLAAVGYSPEQEALLRQRNSGLPLSLRIPEPGQRMRLLAGETIVVDLTKPPFNEQRRLYGVSQAVIVPMRVGERAIGALGMNPLPNVSLTGAELALAEGVAQMAALVIERDRLLREREEARASALALREANRRMEEFLGIAGHELKTPVTVIKANIQLLTRTGRRDSREADLLQRSQRQVDRLTRLVEDLLDVSRIRADKLELDRQPADLAAILRDIVEGQRLAHPDRAITVKLPRRDTVPVLVDADRLGQVLTNYLTNALKYSPEDRPVAVSLHVRGQTARVAVRDEGDGIPSEEQVRVWEAFHRVPGIEVQSGSGIGLGLGLHISKTIVERHGGAVGVESAPGNGSTFWFTLPLAES